MKIQKIMMTIIEQAEVDAYVCTDGTSFRLSQEDEARAHQQLIDDKKEAESHLVFKETDDYRLIRFDDRRWVKAYFEEKWVNTYFHEGESESKWYTYEYYDGGDYSSDYSFTPVETLFREVEIIRNIIGG